MNDVEKTENVEETDISTYRMNHTMIRVKDKDVSLKFYQEVMGMTFLRESGGSDFTLYFLAYGPKPQSDKSANGTNPVGAYIKNISQIY